MKDNVLKLYKNDGKFICTYNKDAYILHSIFNYKLVKEGMNDKCGFPTGVIDKITMELERLNISYEVYYKKEIEVSKYFKKNTYIEYYNKSLLQVEIDKKMDLILYKLNHLDKETLNKKLEDIINMI